MKELKLRLPATSANLGPAFDAAAVALDLYLDMRGSRAEQFSVTADGHDSDISARLENHLILTTYTQVLQSENKPVVPLALKISNEFPIGKGCGSSAAARLAGIALAVHFGRLRWDSNRIIGEASRREHHPDNAAACWMGGVAVARTLSDGQAQVANFMPKGRWPLLLAVPEDALPTESAREVLPQQYSRADVVTNIQNSMLLLSALCQGDQTMLAPALDDKLHQPWRARLCPLLPALQGFPRDEGVLGAVLSGAGPSVLMFLDARISPEKTQARVATYLRKIGMKAELVATSIARRGGSDSFRRGR